MMMLGFPNEQQRSLDKVLRLVGNSIGFFGKSVFTMHMFYKKKVIRGEPRPRRGRAPAEIIHQFPTGSRRRG
ncbi:unnamed protein product [Orchesella dallaii]|uniref:Uncharacterized protein n=1 Tax=Orchesella dallaii TaxID=48710 RepID=A0ABP1RZ86_9HEXA